MLHFHHGWVWLVSRSFDTQSQCRTRLTRATLSPARKRASRSVCKSLLVQPPSRTCWQKWTNPCPGLLSPPPLPLTSPTVLSCLLACAVSAHLSLIHISEP